MCFQEMMKKGWSGSKYEVRSRDDENRDTIRYDSKHEMGFQRVRRTKKVLKKALFFQTRSELL